MSMIIELDDREGLEAAEAAAALSVGTLDPGPDAITPEEWAAGNIADVVITATPPEGGAPKSRPAKSYAEYVQARVVLRAKGYTITTEQPRTAAELLPGLLTLDSAIDIFQNADMTIYKFSAFPELSKLAKIGKHAFITLAADTGAGKSSLAINLLDSINGQLPVLYINREMDRLQIIQRLVAVHGRLELDQIEGYQRDKNTAAAVNDTLKAVTSRKSLQIREDLYYIDEIETAIRDAAQGRTEPTLVIIDHGLLLGLKGSGKKSQYEIFTEIALRLRAASLKNNVIVLCLLQMSRDSKRNGNEDKEPSLWSLKSTGEWENSSTHVMFLWENPESQKKELILAKNRVGRRGKVVLDYNPKMQIYREAAGQNNGLNINNITLPEARKSAAPPIKPYQRMKAEWEAALRRAEAESKGQPVSWAFLAEIAELTVGTVKDRNKTYGGVELVDPKKPNGEIIITGFLSTSGRPGEAPF